MNLSADERSRRRTTFNEVAGAYEKARPGYPPELFDDLVTDIGGDREVVEIGCGTGQATRPLLERGCRVTAIEIGDEMAKLAADRLGDFGDAFTLVRRSFEESDRPTGSADAVVAATAFHWIEPGFALRESARILRPAGLLAVWRIVDIPPPTGAPDFIAASQRIYQELGIAKPHDYIYFGPGARPPEYIEQIQESSLFTDVRIRRYGSNQLLTTERYLAQRRTHSDVLTMTADLREQLLERLGELAETEFGGSFTRYADAVVCSARSSAS